MLRDHPRIRGEHVGSPPRPPQFQGSSPHTRGARFPSWRRARRSRIIPAYAGSTLKTSSTAPMDWDHPRIRGEHAAVPGRRQIDGGSSPHTRGARPAPRRSRRPAGIIPAYAGSTLTTATAPVKMADHPRIRGEHDVMKGSVGKATGSSPHTRGARKDAGKRWRSYGIIPAYAGSTLHCSRSAPVSGDHPRIRGEHCWDSVPLSFHFGSSPHTRGAHRRIRKGVRP